MPRNTLARHCLHGELASPGTRRFPCPTWLCFVVLRADRSLQSSSRPPSSRAFLVGYRKVYSVRCEADVVMTSPTRFFANHCPSSEDAMTKASNCRASIKQWIRPYTVTRKDQAED